MDRSALLRKINLFHSLSEDDQRGLGERLIERNYSAGQLVFAKGDSGTSMFLIVGGVVRVFLPPSKPGAPRVVLKEMRAGEHFGELALFDSQPRSASAEAVESTVLLELSRDDFINSLARSPSAVLSVLGEMARRLRDTNALLSQRAAKDAIREVEESLSWSERLADRVAEINGSWFFIIFLCVLSLAWAAANYWMPHPFDAYPYVFFNLILALLVALQGPLIVMSQNRGADKERAQAASDFQVNLKNEVNIEMILREMGEFRRDATARLEQLEKSRMKAAG
jgi:uncharacterized membrane protein